MIRMSLKIDSLILHETIEVKVALPCSILNIGKKFKTVWCLHCAMSSGDLFFERLSMLDYVEQYKLIVIAPSLPNTFFVNSKQGNYGDFLDSELYPLIKSMLPVSDSKVDNCVLGVSMGAFGALAWKLRKPELFSSVVAISGYYDHSLPFDPKISKLKATYALSRLIVPYVENVFSDNEEISPAIIKKQLKHFALKDDTKFLFYTGDHDYLSLSQSKNIYVFSKESGLNVEYKEVLGDHNVSCWCIAIKMAITRLFEQ